ncbi:MAG: hypothetical protein F6K24_10285 [Okeania sp. SIO2D1]|nr:hypothetical protein [Okeania sp. SIO2D1]
MGRPKREFKANYSYHITTRCNNRDFNLTRRETREILLHIIKQAQEKYPFKLYALCIMLNHVHYLMEAENPRVIALAKLCDSKRNEVKRLWSIPERKAISNLEIASLR